MKILAIDVGGTHVKIQLSGQNEIRKFVSGPTLTARQMVGRVQRLAKDWKFDVVSIGYPGPVVAGKPVVDPKNLGRGWARFNFAKAFRKPVKVINDAAMQALGSYRGGKMLFLGLGTGLGTAIIDKGVIEPMEIAHLPYMKGRTFEDYVGLRGLRRLGKKKWRATVADVVKRLSLALEADSVVLGGGNAKKLKTLPPLCRMGNNANAFRGGFRLWAGDAKPTAKPRRAKTAKRARPSPRTTTRAVKAKPQPKIAAKAARTPAKMVKPRKPMRTTTAKPKRPSINVSAGTAPLAKLDFDSIRPIVPSV